MEIGSSALTRITTKKAPQLYERGWQMEIPTQHSVLVALATTSTLLAMMKNPTIFLLLSTALIIETKDTMTPLHPSQNWHPSPPLANNPPDMVPDDEQSPKDMHMGYQMWLGNLPFHRLQEGARQGILPGQIADCKISKCPSCLCGKAKCRPWKSQEWWSKSATLARHYQTRWHGICWPIDFLSPWIDSAEHGKNDKRLTHASHNFFHPSFIRFGVCSATNKNPRWDMMPWGNEGLWMICNMTPCQDQILPL